MVPPKSFMTLGSSGGLLFLGEQLAEHRIDVAAVADLAHGHRRAGFADRSVGLPQIGVAADEAGREVLGIAADFQVGIVLADRQDAVGQQRRGLVVVGRRVVTV